MRSDLLVFLKALGDSTRLTIVGLLAAQPRSVDELAAILGLSDPTISHHLGRLQEAGLVSAEAQQYYSIYTLRAETLERYARQLASPGALADLALSRASVDPAAYPREVLARWVEDGRLKALPSQSRHRQIVLGWLRDKFAPDTRYSPGQTDALLERWCAVDTRMIARALIEARLLAQSPDGSWLWRADSPAAGAIEPATAEHMPVAADPAPLAVTRGEGAPDGRMDWPADAAGRARVLMALAAHFQRGRHYAEVEVEDVIRQHTTGDPHEVRVELLRACLLRRRERGGYVIYRRTGRGI